MARITISSHTIRVSEKRFPDKSELVDQIGKFNKDIAIEKDLYFELENALKENKYSKNETKEKSWVFSNIHRDKNKRIICGIVRYGEYGYEADIVDVDSNIKQFKRLKTQAELMPYYFLMYIPKNSEVAYVVLQRFQKFGIQTIFLEELKNVLSTSLQDYTLRMNNFFSEEAFKKILNESEVKAIKSTKTYRKELSSDPIENIDGKEQKKKITKDYQIETNLKPYNSESFVATFGRTLLDRSSKGEEIQPATLESIGLSADCDELSVVVEHDKMTRTITLFSKEVNLNFENQLYPYINITGKVKIDKSSGHPEFDSIDKLAKDYLFDLIGE